LQTKGSAIRDNGEMTEETEEDETGTYVIFSLSVDAEPPKNTLSDIPGRRRPRRPDDDFHYDFGQVSFDEARWDVRADRLDAVVNDALDRLEATGVDPGELKQEDVLVRAFFTFDPGAETLRASVIERLARWHATIWIDANQGGGYSGMTTNERLGVAGLIEVFDSAIQRQDRRAAIATLSRVDLGSQAASIVDTILANPAKYGFRPPPNEL